MTKGIFNEVWFFEIGNLKSEVWMWPAKSIKILSLFSWKISRYTVRLSHLQNVSLFAVEWTPGAMCICMINFLDFSFSNYSFNQWIWWVPLSINKLFLQDISKEFRDITDRVSPMSTLKYPPSIKVSWIYASWGSYELGLCEVNQMLKRSP